MSLTWIKLGAIAGIIACVIYPLMVAVEMPRLLTVACAAAFGPLLSLASVGLYHLLKLNQKTVTAQIAAGANIIAGSIVNMMLVVQLAISIHQPGLYPVGRPAQGHLRFAGLSSTLRSDPAQPCGGISLIEPTLPQVGPVLFDPGADASARTDRNPYRIVFQ